MAATKKSTGKTANKSVSRTKKVSKQSIAQANLVKEKYVPTEKDIKIRNELKLLVVLAAVILLMLSNFGLLSPVGDYVSFFMFGLFGTTAYVFPLILFLGTAFAISNYSHPKILFKVISSCTLYIMICSLLEIVMFEYNEVKAIGAYYIDAGNDKMGGGLVGGLVNKLFISTIGIVGTYVVIILLIMVCIVIITERSLIGGVKNSSKRMYNSAKEDMTKIIESSQERAEDRRYYEEQRMNNKVKGVAIDTKIEDPDRIEDEMHEITDKYDEQFGDAEIYRGHFEIDDEENDYTDETDNMQEFVRPIKSEVTYNSFVQEEISEDAKNGEFTPKEKIEVSKSALNEMSRKPFTVGVKPVTVGVKPVTTNTPQTAPAYIPKRPIKPFVLPTTVLLSKGNMKRKFGGDAELRATATKLQNILENFGVMVTVTNYSRGPSVTRYELQPETGTKVSKITSLADDIKLNLAAADIRIEAPIPGKAAVGIEVPNDVRETVLLRDLVESKELMEHPSKLAFAAGKDIAGKVVVADLAKMPHMLIAGTTGSGKSVFTNSIIMSILFRAKPSEVKLIIIDPKVVEFGVYNGIPHLLQPVVTDSKQASTTLKWAVAQMSDRYKRFADLNVRDLRGYNEKVENMKLGLDEERPEKIPQIVIIIDELADLMMAAAKEVEESICRLAQLARAAGIHLVIATQRPSVDVVTGLIKANVPSRVALLVSSGVDSRTIIDMNGAEKLLGNGDMLFYPSGYVKPVRIQGAFVSDSEVHKVVQFLTSQNTEVKYDEKIIQYLASSNTEIKDDNERDEYFTDAGIFIIKKEKASASMLQRVFKIGFNRAARIIDQLAEAGVIGEEEGTKPRRVIMTMKEFEEL